MTLRSNKNPPATITDVDSEQAEEIQEPPAENSPRIEEIATNETTSLENEPQDNDEPPDNDEPLTNTTIYEDARDETLTISSEETEIAEIMENKEFPEKPRLVVSPVVQKFSELAERTLDKFIREYGIQVKISKISAIRGNSKQRKLEKIAEWITDNRPDWDKDEDGNYLIRYSSLHLDKKLYLNMMTLPEIKVLTKHLGLPIDFTGKDKSEIIQIVTEKTLEKFPTFTCTKGGNLIIDPKNFA